MRDLHGKALVAGLAAAVMAGSAAVPAVEAAAVRSGFDSNTLVRNDDESTDLVDIGFDANFFGSTYSQLYVNNNGNVTFNDSLFTYTPFNLETTERAIIAPFFADVDTREGGEPVTYGQGTLDGRDAFGVNWVDVNYYNATGNSDRENLNSFQLVMVDRSDVNPGDFDFEFNFDTIQWETGEASGSDEDGLGGDSARVGYSNGEDESFELSGSAVNGAFLDSNTNTGLIHNRTTNTNVNGRYRFEVRNGSVGDPQVVPLPAAGWAGLAGLALLGGGRALKRWRREDVV